MSYLAIHRFRFDNMFMFVQLSAKKEIAPVSKPTPVDQNITSKYVALGSLVFTSVRSIVQTSFRAKASACIWHCFLSVQHKEHVVMGRFHFCAFFSLQTCARFENCFMPHCKNVQHVLRYYRRNNWQILIKQLLQHSQKIKTPKTAVIFLKLRIWYFCSLLSVIAS